jgi:hypothetical protein
MSGTSTASPNQLGHELFSTGMMTLPKSTAMRLGQDVIVPVALEFHAEVGGDAIEGPRDRESRRCVNGVDAERLGPVQQLAAQAAVDVARRRVNDDYLHCSLPERPE